MAIFDTSLFFVPCILCVPWFARLLPPRPYRAKVFYDELRWGTDFDRITVIPEPSTLVLMGLSVIGLVLFRRRR